MPELLSHSGVTGLDSGPAAALLAALLWAFTSILFTAAGRNVVPTATNLFKTLAATLLFGVVLLFRDGLPFDQSLTGRQVGLLVLSGVVGLSLGDSFLFMGFQILGTRRAMLVQSVHPIVGTLLAVVLFRELPSLLQFLGIVVVLAGIVLVLGDGHRKATVDGSGSSSACSRRWDRPSGRCWPKKPSSGLMPSARRRSGWPELPRV